MTKNKRYTNSINKFQVITSIDCTLHNTSKEDTETFNISELNSQIFGLVLSYFGCFKKSSSFEISVKISSPQEIKSLNQQFRQKDYVTNVLSFPHPSDGSNHQYLGDIIICMDQLKLEATEQKKKLKNHYIHILLHAILHLLGFDHIEEDEAFEMEEIEKKLLSLFDISDPYIENFQLD